MTMPDLIAPHGGLTEPVDRTVAAAEREKLRAGQLSDARIMRPETAQILIERMIARLRPLR
jgi:hypothetical protein